MDGRVGGRKEGSSETDGRKREREREMFKSKVELVALESKEFGD